MVDVFAIVGQIWGFVSGILIIVLSFVNLKTISNFFELIVNLILHFDIILVLMELMFISLAISKANKGEPIQEILSFWINIHITTIRIISSCIHTFFVLVTRVLHIIAEAIPF